MKAPTLKRVFESKWTDKLHGGLADKDKPSEFNFDELQKGIKHELEHTNDKHIATEIAMDHLSEDPHYYSNMSNRGEK